MNWNLLQKSGFANGGWTYEELEIAYNQDKDIDTLSDVNYNSLGTHGTWSNLNKS